MRLSEFIENTLYEIALGVELGKARSIDFIAINPSSIDGQPIAEKNYVEFDVSLVVEEESQDRSQGDRKLGGEIQVVSLFKLSGSVNKSNERTSGASSQQMHRIAFKVPLHMHASYKGNPAASAAAAEILGKKHLL